MIENGFTPINNSIVHSQWYSDPQVRNLVMHLAMTSNFRTGYFLGVEVRRGQRITSMANLGKEMGWPKTTTIDVLSRAIEYGAIIKTPDRKWTKLTLGESILYEPENTSSRPQADRSPTGPRPQADPIEEKQKQQYQQDPPPPAHEQIEPDEWGEVVARLSSLGVGKARDAAHKARSAGLSPDDINQICDHFQSKLTATHETGALYLRLTQAVADVPADQGWPPAKSAPQTMNGDPATTAWGNVLRASKIWTRYDSGRCEEAREMLTTRESQAVDAIGGFSKIQNCESDKIHFLKADFARVYREEAREAVA